MVKVGAAQRKTLGAVCLERVGFLSSMFDVLCICILELERGGKVIEYSGLEPLGSVDVQHRILHLVMWAVLR